MGDMKKPHCKSQASDPKSWIFNDMKNTGYNPFRSIRWFVAIEAVKYKIATIIVLYGQFSLDGKGHDMMSLISDLKCCFRRSPMQQHISNGEQVRDMILIRLTNWLNWCKFYYIPPHNPLIFIFYCIVLQIYFLSVSTYIIRVMALCSHLHRTDIMFNLYCVCKYVD